MIFLHDCNLMAIKCVENGARCIDCKQLIVI